MTTFLPVPNHRSPIRRRLSAAGAALVVAGVASASWTGISSASPRLRSHPIKASATTTCGQAFTAPQVCTYTGDVQPLVVPTGVDQVTIVATGGDGSGDYAWPDDQAGGYGAVVTGTLSVQPGQRLLVSVGGQGEQGGTTSSDPRSGWGGLGDNGGNGNGASDHVRTSGAGGGASTVQLENADGSDLTTVLVSAGGGGGGGASGDPGAPARAGVPATAGREPPAAVAAHSGAVPAARLRPSRAAAEPVARAAAASVATAVVAVAVSTAATGAVGPKEPRLAGEVGQDPR